MQRQPYVECLSTTENLALDLDNNEPQIDIRAEQRSDPVIWKWIQHVRRGVKPRKVDIPSSPVHSQLYNNFERLHLKDGILFRRTTNDNETKDQLVLPASQVPVVLRALHNDMGHQGRDRTTSLVKDRFYWYGITRDIDNWIQRCPRCLKRKKPTTERAPLTSIETSQPMEIVCMDFLTLERSKGGYQHILVITDHFTRYAQAVATKNMGTKTTADAFFNHFVTHYGLPHRIHTDQGGNFESRLMKELCNLTGVQKSRTTPYHPMGNGQCERFNRTLLSMLGTLENHQKSDWKSYLSPIVHAYNCTKQETTGYSPFALMFGREPRLPIDQVYGLNNRADQKTTTQYVENMKKRLQKSYELAANSAKKAQGRQKKAYDTKVRGAVLHPGDRVLVKILQFDGKHKLSDKWEDDAYEVIEQPNPEIPVYVVKKENGQGRRRTLHRNLLLPIGSVSTDEKNEEKQVPTPRPQPRPRTRNTVKRDSTPDPSPESVPSDTESDSENESLVFVWRQPEVIDDSTPHSASDESVTEDVDDDVNDAADDDQEQVIEQQDDGLVEDALPSEEQEADDPTPAQETDNVDDTAAELSQDTEENDVAGDQDEPGQDTDVAEAAEPIRHPERPTVAPRRSVRAKTSTADTKYKDFVLSKQLQNQDDWMTRAQLLKDLLSSDASRGREDRILEELLKLTTNKDN